MVASLARPGGNITGLSFMSSELAAKRLELLKETFPRVTRVAVLWTFQLTGVDGAGTTADARPLPARSSVTLQPLGSAIRRTSSALFGASTRERADALLVFAHAFAFVHRDQHR